jgi:hypothetical protein
MPEPACFKGSFADKDKKGAAINNRRAHFF